MSRFIDKVSNGSNRSTVDDDGHECHSKIRGPVLKNPRVRSWQPLRPADQVPSGRPRRRGSDRKPAVNSPPGCKLHNGELAQSCWSPRKKKGWWWRVALQRRFARGRERLPREIQPKPAHLQSRL